VVILARRERADARDTGEIPFRGQFAQRAVDGIAKAARTGKR